MLPTVSAIEVTDISESLTENNAIVSELKADVSSKLSELDTKLDSLVTEAELTTLLTAHLIKTDEIFDHYRSWLTVSFIIIGFCLIGLLMGGLFFFKAKGRL